MTPETFARNPDPRFYPFLRSGKDDWSKLRLHKLITLIAPADLLVIQGELDDPGQVASACRWVLRGLPVSHAVGVVRYHANLAEAIAERCRLDAAAKECVG